MTEVVKMLACGTCGAEPGKPCLNAATGRPRAVSCSTRPFCIEENGLTEAQEARIRDMSRLVPKKHRDEFFDGCAGLVTGAVGRDPTDAEVDAAARVLYAEGSQCRWWPELGKTYDEFAADEIGREEFEAIVSRILAAASRAGGR